MINKSVRNSSQSYAVVAVATLIVGLVFSTQASARWISSNDACSVSDVQNSGDASACIGILSVEGPPPGSNNVNDSESLFNNTNVYGEQSGDSSLWAIQGTDDTGDFGAGFFGFQDWSKAWKQDFEDSGIVNSDGGLGVSISISPPGENSGDWSISGDWNDFGHFLLAFKQDTRLSTYLFTLDDLINGGTSGTFSQMGDFNAMSHVSLYVRGEGTPVPAPATLALLGAGLIGLAVVRRRRILS